MSSNSIQKLPLLPLRDLIIFPHMMMPLFVGREKSINALEEAMTKQTDIVLAAQKDPKSNAPQPDEIYKIGTIGTIIQLLRLPDGTVKVLVEGKRRASIKSYVQQDGFFIVEAEEMKENVENMTEARALLRSIKTTFETYVKLNKRIPPEILRRVSTIEEIGELGDIIVAQLNLKLEDKQRILEVPDPGKRLEELLNLMTGEIEILEVERKIRGRVKKQMERSQKEYYLNEQMQAIQKELGEKDDYQAELEELSERLDEKKMSEEAKKKVKKEIKKLKMMSPMSAEAAVVRNYIDWMLDLPWLSYAKEKHDIAAAKAVLDDDHW
ncbi:MAG: LON peptidase substrate-binding domain-containing protein, partial [Bdellovibrionales bacterium]|nr:LON peptidase substrate-binding domain-containing protein [Bdellovibrionales bacterium]